MFRELLFAKRKELRSLRYCLLQSLNGPEVLAVSTHLSNRFIA